ncbi:MAG TPA: hypothetical protein VN456_12050 [Desulfosporosinus sp.]|nr:hypothetical protein [Desulfosporosinus sp.]
MKDPQAGANMEVADEIGQLNQSTQLTNQLSDSIGLDHQKFRNSEERELTPS